MLNEMFEFQVSGSNSLGFAALITIIFCLQLNLLLKIYLHTLVSKVLSSGGFLLVHLSPNSPRNMLSNLNQEACFRKRVDACEWGWNTLEDLQTNRQLRSSTSIMALLTKRRV